MASTNKTTNYNLSQFIGSDKPAWLTDYNADMSKIDAGVAAAQTTATGADGKATANTSAIGDLSSLTTTAKTNLVAAANEINTAAGTALSTANSAAGAANQANSKVNALADYFVTTPTKIPVANIISQTGAFSQTDPDITIAKNSTNSLGKVYGRISHKPTAAGNQTILINIDSGIHPDADFTITPAGVGNCTNQDVNQKLERVTLTFKTNGNIVITYYADYPNTYYIFLWPCLYFFTDFGDLPEE